MLKQAYKKVNNFIEPSDELIARTIDTPFLSLRPEDLPHFRIDARQPYTQLEMTDRILSLRERIVNFHPAYDLPDNELAQLAGAFSAQIHTFHEGGSRKPSLCVMLRPSRIIDYPQTVANQTGIDVTYIRDAVPLQEDNFLGMLHELGHITGDKNYHDEWREELRAESFSFFMFKGENGSYETLKIKISERALAGFLTQPVIYWLAPFLDYRLTNDFFVDEPSQEEVWASYTELRVRSAMHIIGRDMTTISSDVLKEALFHHDADKRWNGPQEVVDAVDAFFSSDTDEKCKDKVLFLAALNHCLTQTGLDDTTRACGAQIMQAVRDLCPSLIFSTTMPVLANQLENV